MSHVTVFAIRQDGDVEKLGDASNGMAGAMFIWSSLARRYGLPEFTFDGPLPIWKRFTNPAAPVHERIALGFTFDNVWVAKANIPRLVEALEMWWREYGNERVARTVPTMVEIMKSAAGTDLRGVCFMHSSVSENPWELQDGEDDYRSFNFDTDKKTSTGGEPWELFDDLDKRIAAGQ